MSVDTRASNFFVAGGTLRLDAPSYVKRREDDELLDLALTGEFCYVLTPRQMGKSSLMVQAVRRLQERGVRTAIIDLTSIGTDASVEQWYLGLITRLTSQLRLRVDPEAWWVARASLGVVQRFTDFLHDVVFVEIGGPVVVFIDEIDTTLNLGFSDDFFAAIRSTYNARASDPAYNRLTFVLLGVAAPADLIKDPNRTPFNIGYRVDLHEFSQEDAGILQQGLEAVFPKQGQTIFARIYHWTNGHPYLTQKLCLAATEAGNGRWTDERVDGLVERLFLAKEARKEGNLQFVRSKILDHPQGRQLLALYHKVYRGREIRENERSPVQNQLKLSGLVRAEEGTLRVRNEIYRQVFNLDWIKDNTPVDWTRRIAGILALLVVFLGGAIGFSIYRQGQMAAEVRAQAFVDSFRSTTSAEVRVTSLAGLFGLPDYENQARQLFYEELSSADQLALFDLADPQTVETQLITTVKGLYSDQKDNESGNALLHAMIQPLRKLDDPLAVNLATEIEQWLQGRAYHAQGEYQQAITAYSVAISLNDHNPGTFFDRGLAYVALHEPSLALADFEAVLNRAQDQDWQESVRQTVMANDQIHLTLWREGSTYPALATLVPTPTPTNTPTFTSTPKPTHTSTVTPRATPTPTPTRLPPPTPIPTVLQLTSGLGQDREPSFSPDGTRIAFISDQDGNQEIYVVSVDGSGLRRLTFTPDIQEDLPSFSPDGSKIIFGSINGHDEELYMMNTDGSQIQNISNAPNSNEGRPRFSSSSLLITFDSDRNGNWEIYTARLQADELADVKQVTNRPDFIDRLPSFSPSGDLILFRAQTAGRGAESSRIYLTGIDGSVVRLSAEYADWYPAMSPNGKWIAFVSDRDGNSEIYVMDLNGSNVTRLTNNPASDQDPAFSPGGRWLAFASDRGGNSFDIFRLSFEPPAP